MRNRKLMKKVFAAIIAVLACTIFSSCKDSDNVSAGITDLTESETEETVSKTDSETATEAQAETYSETTAKAELISEAITVTQQTTETKAEASEEYENIGMISEFKFGYTYPEKKAHIFFSITPRHSRVYVFAWGDNEKTHQGVITDNQLMKLADTLNDMKISQYNGYDNSDENDSSLLLDLCSLDITDTDGKIITAKFRGDIPEIFNELIEDLNKLASGSHSGNDFQEKAQIGIDKAADAMIYCRSYLTKYLDLGGDPLEFADKTLVITENDTDPLGENVWAIPDDWYGFAFVKFTADGKDVEYANWSETEEGLAENKLIYDDLEAFYLENGTIIGTV